LISNFVYIFIYDIPHHSLGILITTRDLLYQTADASLGSFHSEEWEGGGEEENTFAQLFRSQAWIQLKHINEKLL
jgi:hypothetical protein